MKRSYRLNWIQSVGVSSSSSSSSSTVGANVQSLPPLHPVYLKPSRSGRRKPSFVVTRMRDGQPGYAFKSPPLGPAAPLFRITSPSCEYYALRLPLLKAGFRRLPATAVISPPCNVLWGRSVPARSIDDAKGLALPLETAATAANEVGKNVSSLRMVSPHQRFNHFPRSHGGIGCKWGLTRHLRRAAARGGEHHYDFVPRSWLYPDERNAMLQAFADAPPTRRFIWKPARGSCGRGILTSLGGAANASTWTRVEAEIERRATAASAAVTVASALATNVSRKYVVQEYIENPLLLNGRKTDLRLYVAVTSYDPLTVYWHEEGLVRLAAEPYGDGGVWLNFNPFRDLTNYSVGKHWESSRSKQPHIQQQQQQQQQHHQLLQQQERGRRQDSDAVDTRGEEDGVSSLELKKGLGDLWAHIDAMHPTLPRASAAVWASIRQQIVKTLLAVKSPMAAATKQQLPLPGGFFELYGFDIMLDAQLKPWLIEVNTLPSLASTSPLDYTTKTNVVADLLNLAMIEPFERTPSCFGDVGLSNPSLIEPLSREAQRTVNRLDAETAKPLGDREARMEVRLRLQDELEYRGGFRRVFPPLPTDSVADPATGDLINLAKRFSLSKADEWALEG